MCPPPTAADPPSTPLPPAGWFPDPQGRQLRWWNGTDWTDQVTPFPDGGPAAKKAHIPRWLGPVIAGGVVLLIAIGIVTETGADGGGSGVKPQRAEHSRAWEDGYDFGYYELGPNSGAGWGTYPKTVDGLADYCVDVLGIQALNNPPAYIRGCGHGLHDFLK